MFKLEWKCARSINHNRISFGDPLQVSKKDLYCSEIGLIIFNVIKAQNNADITHYGFKLVAIRDLC